MSVASPAVLSAPTLPPAFAQAWRQGKRAFAVASDEPLLQQEAADALRAQAQAEGYQERQLFVVQGVHFKWGEVSASAGALSLFAQQRLLELRLPSGKPGKEGSQVLQELLPQLGPGQALLLLLPRVDKAMRSSPWFAALQQHGAVLELATVERQHLPQWMAQRLAQQGQQLKPDEGERSLRWMSERLEGNLLAAHQELMKLALLYPPGELSFEQISASVSNVARYDLFKLSDAVLGGQVLRTQRMLEGLRAEGEAEVQVHWVLSEDIRALHRARRALAAGLPLPQAVAQARVWGAKQKHIDRLLHKLSLAQTTALLHAASQVDGVVKGLPQKNWPSNGWAALQQLALQLCRMAAA